MRMKTIALLAVILAAFATLGFSCINEGFLVSINLEGISGVYTINAGDGKFNECSNPVSPNTYLGTTYADADIRDARIYDIKVSTIGTYTGNVNGSVTVNGVTILTFNGAFSYFNTPRSLLTDPNITRSSPGILTLVTAIKNRQTITLCGTGGVSPSPFPSGQKVKIEVLGQIDAEP